MKKKYYLGSLCGLHGAECTWKLKFFFSGFENSPVVRDVFRTGLFFMYRCKFYVTLPCI